RRRRRRRRFGSRRRLWLAWCRSGTPRSGSEGPLPAFHQLNRRRKAMVSPFHNAAPGCWVSTLGGQIKSFSLIFFFLSSIRLVSSFPLSYVECYVMLFWISACVFRPLIYSFRDVG
ncbi:hypothetical protein BHE74_00019748, partial [Ensete ventricosum]